MRRHRVRVDATLVSDVAAAVVERERQRRIRRPREERRLAGRQSGVESERTARAIGEEVVVLVVVGGNAGQRADTHAAQVQRPRLALGQRREFLHRVDADRGVRGQDDRVFGKA